MARAKKAASTEPDPEPLRIQELFRGLIRSRARAGGLPVPRRLPTLTREILAESGPRWFPVPGMYGGFAFRPQERGTELQLITHSWCRLADGSELRHKVTAKEVVLEPE